MIEVAWAVVYLVYALRYAERSACLFNLPCPAECDPWITEAVPVAFFAVEAVFLQAATIEYAVLCCTANSYAARAGGAPSAR